MSLKSKDRIIQKEASSMSRQGHAHLEVNGDFRMRELDHNDLEQFNALFTVCFSGNLLRALPDRLGARRKSNMPNVRFSRTLMYSVGFYKEKAGIHDRCLFHADQHSG